jgi:DNA polymerase I
VSIAERYQSIALEKGDYLNQTGEITLSDADKENSITNHPIQGTGADGFKMTLVDLDEKLSGQDALIVYIHHDEIIVEAREDIAGDVAVVTVKACLEKAFTEIFPDLLFVVTPETRESWG